MARRRNPYLSVVTNPPEPMSEEVQTIGYKHVDDGHDYIHQFGPGVEMEANPDGTLTITHAAARELHRDHGGQTFLVNPPKAGGRAMAKKRLPPRHQSGPKKGQFRKRATSKRRRTTTKRRRNMPATRSRAQSRPRAPAKRRRNPPRRGAFSPRKLVRDLTQGSVDAVLMLAGKAGTRTIPAMLPNLPKEGNLGLAVQALTAVVVAVGAGMFLTASQAKMVLAGGLSAPIETLVVSFDVPFLADALAPVTADQQLSAYYGYVQPALPPGDAGTVGAYVQEGADLALGGYDYNYDM